MHELYGKFLANLTYLFSCLTAWLSFLDQYAAGIGALATIIVALATLWFKAQHLKIAKAHGHNHDADGNTAIEEAE